MIISNVKNLNQGETLKVLRRRAGLTRAELAKKLQVCENTIYNWESGNTQQVDLVTIEFPEISLVKLEDYEICFIIRNRKKLTQAHVAKKLKLSRYWINLMEQGKKDCSRLLTYLKGIYE